jgi:hypothetical protein
VSAGFAGFPSPLFGAGVLVVGGQMRDSGRRGEWRADNLGGAMSQIEVSGVREAPEDDGSHFVELADGSAALVPASMVPNLIEALQGGLARRVFAQSQQLEQPTDATLALREFHVTDARAATLGRSTNLACNLSEYGWVVLVSEDAILHQMKEKIDQILVERSSSARTN